MNYLGIKEKGCCNQQWCMSFWYLIVDNLHFSFPQKRRGQKKHDAESSMPSCMPWFVFIPTREIERAVHFLHCMACAHSYSPIWYGNTQECDMVPNFEDIRVAPTQKMALGFWQQDKINSNKMQMSTYLVMFSFTSSSLGYVVC